MEKGIIYWHSMSDSALLKQIGIFLKQTRLSRQKTQLEVAIVAGLNRTTLVQMEKGEGGTLHSFIQVLRALEQLQLLEQFEYKQPLISPLELAEKAIKMRKRVRKKKEDERKSEW